MPTTFQWHAALTKYLNTKNKGYKFLINKKKKPCFRQGFCISPTLFKIYIRKVLDEWKRKCHGMGVPLENITLYTLQFADDQVVLAWGKEDLEYMTRNLKETYEKWGLDMNLNKTKYLCIGETQNNLKLDKDNEIEFCQEYKYLGVIFDTSGKTTKNSDQE